MNQQMIGKVLQARYQIVQSLSGGVFGQTYIALDLYNREKPRYVVKKLRIDSYPSNSCFDYLKLRFLKETESLIHLGSHDQIPQLITFFEESQQFYLVQEFIPGQELSAELPVNQHGLRCWSPEEVIILLEDVLTILEFVHAQGFIHGDLKPENLIRRASDGKLVLIDFGSIQPVHSRMERESPNCEIPLTSLGYIPPEQFIGQIKPNSDIYALGMIGIQALTGLVPLKLKIDPQTQEINWRDQHKSVNAPLADILSLMIRFHHQERFQSAGETLAAISELKWRTQPIQGDKSPLLAGLKVGLAINSLLIGLGICSLVNNSPNHSDTNILYQAVEKYQGGDLKQAINLAKSIPEYSSLYPEAQATIIAWENSPEKPVDTKWANTIGESPEIDLELKAHILLNKAYAKANNRDFSAALVYLRQIPPESAAGAIVAQKLVEYHEKRQIRATYLLDKANHQASIGDISTAIKLLRKIPQNTAVYASAQIKLSEYSQKLKITSMLDQDNHLNEVNVEHLKMIGNKKFSS
jgi:serine/threonine protein kinase/chaperonin cofactor prefoldin